MDDLSDSNIILNNQPVKKLKFDKTDKKKEYLELMKDNYSADQTIAELKAKDAELDENHDAPATAADSIEREPSKKLYKGMSSYESFCSTEKPKSNSTDLKTKRPGVAANSIRETTVFDFKPDICKDYKVFFFLFPLIIAKF